MVRTELRRLAKAAAITTPPTLPPLAHGPVVTGDTYLPRSAASTNFGALASIQVGPGTGSPQSQGLVKFGLSGLSGVTASDVQKAIIWVYVNRVTVAGSIDVWHVTSPWSESTVTFNTAPGV